MGLYDQGITTPYNAVAAGVIPVDVYGIAMHWFVNRTPLFTRLPALPCGSDSFLLTNDNYRPRSVTLSTSIADAVVTTLTLVDATSFDVGDVLQIESEFLLVTAVPQGGTTLTVVRGYAGSTAAGHTAPLPLYLVTNVRTGAEVDINAISRVPITVEQFNQTSMKAYQVGGSLQANKGFMGGMTTPLDRDRMMAIQHVVDDMESAILYGAGAKRSGTVQRPMMKGLRTLIVTNRQTNPTNKNAYKPQDLIRDAIQPCWAGGGQPNVLMVSTDFMTGLSIWGNQVLKVDAGETVFGTKINVFCVSFLPDIMIIPNPMLKVGTVSGMSVDEVRMRMKRGLFEKPRGSRGDAEEGDMICEGAVELDNESHHSWVEGITAFSNV